MQKIFARTLATLATAVAVLTAPVATTTVSVATVATPATIVVAASMLVPTSAQAGRKDGVTDPNGLVLSERPVSLWEQFKAWISGLVLHEEREN